MSSSKGDQHRRQQLCAIEIRKLGVVVDLDQHASRRTVNVALVDCVPSATAAKSATRL
jgi:hypothetical protein